MEGRIMCRMATTLHPGLNMNIPYMVGVYPIDPLAE